MSIEMQQLRHFCTAADQRNIGRAARILAISQPALSRSIHNLERALGVTLLERSRRGVQPTAYGELLLSHARTVVNEVERAIQNLQALDGLALGGVSFGFTPNFSRFIVPDALRRVVSESPSIAVVASHGFYEELAVQVRTGTIDFAFALMPEVHGHPDLTEESLLPINFHVFAAPAHALAGRSRVDLADIASHGWAIPDQPAMRLFDRYFETQGVVPPKCVLRTTSISLLIASLESCGLLALLPDHLVTDELARGSIVRLDVPSLPDRKHAALIYRTNGVLSPAARAVMAAVRLTCQLQVSATSGKLAS